ncbi:MAG: flagellar filament capping protein FliD [Spirochaetales bacterium]|nr:flagellar filament capping protein FliD [Spirochaetales bacterium]
MKNPIKRAIIEVLKNTHQPIKEYQLHEILGGKAFEQFVAGCSHELRLFRQHFMVMNALYELHHELLDQHIFLHISALDIRLIQVPTENSGSNNKQLIPDFYASEGFKKLSDYYLDWDNFNKTSDKEVVIEIMPDQESIKDGIISFVGYYNQVLQNIHILTSNDDSVIGELEYLTDEEQEDARKNLGAFQGDMTFSQLKNRMQRIAMEAYLTSAGSDLSLLSQIGISTNSSGFGGGVNKSKLRGYLEINEDTLDEALGLDILPIKDLFGSDTDGDLIIDTGAAYEMERYINSYTQIGGLVASRISGIDSRINGTERSILNMESKLDDKELELRIKFGRMEGALKTMEQNSRTIENFSNNNN